MTFPHLQDRTFFANDRQWALRGDCLWPNWVLRLVVVMVLMERGKLVQRRSGGGAFRLLLLRVLDF